jgi:DNA-binding MarR family transcriptional regulator
MPTPAGDRLEALRTLARISRTLERSSSELSLAQYRVLAAIAAGEERASRVAGRLALGKPTVSAAVDALSQRGLLARRQLSSDQRVIALELTPAGAALLAGVEQQMLGRLDAVLERAPDPDAVVAALVALGRALDAVPAAGGRP